MKPIHTLVLIRTMCKSIFFWVIVLGYVVLAFTACVSPEKPIPEPVPVEAKWDPEVKAWVFLSMDPMMRNMLLDD